MRNNYAGDEGDYAEYALPRVLCEHSGLRLGLNGYPLRPQPGAVGGSP